MYSATPWLGRKRLLESPTTAIGRLVLSSSGMVIAPPASRPLCGTARLPPRSVSLQDARYATSQSVNWLFEQSLARIRELPGVESAAVALSLPYERALNTGFQRLDGRHVDTESQVTNLFYVTPEYFRVLRIPLL